MQTIFISGGAGFIGVNAARRYALKGDAVVIFDDLSRKGSKHNLEWLRKTMPQIEFIEGDIRDAGMLKAILRDRHFDVVLHLAAQVAVTTSVSDPLYDHAVNVLGTIHMLEAVRHGKNPKAAFIFSSTNKVYGGLEQFNAQEKDTRYELPALPLGVSEAVNLDFHSPYGCSKGAADQYVRDYARIYDMNTVVMRQSCIYGERQMGIEDQGWVAWIMSRAALGLPARIYGTGKQVRDLLSVEDLLDAYDAAIHRIQNIRGHIYNMGGGQEFSLSVLEFMQWLKEQRPDFSWEYHDWRPGDQKVYVSDITKAQKELGWQPNIPPKEGLTTLLEWVEMNKELFA